MQPFGRIGAGVGRWERYRVVVPGRFFVCFGNVYWFHILLKVI